MTENINFNKLAWEAPKHGDKVGYLPTDKYYAEIVEWLKTGTKLYVEKTKQSDGTPVIISRVTFENSRYDAVITYVISTKMIAYIFREVGTYAV